MKSRRVIDVVARALNHNTAVVLITTFGSANQVMVFNASTNHLIATVRRTPNDMFLITDGHGKQTHCFAGELAVVLRELPFFPRTLSNHRNYSRPVFKAGVVL
jgi:hypothetical protein